MACIAWAGNNAYCDQHWLLKEFMQCCLYLGIVKGFKASRADPGVEVTVAHVNSHERVILHLHIGKPKVLPTIRSLSKA